MSRRHQALANPISGRNVNTENSIPLSHDRLRGMLFLSDFNIREPKVPGCFGKVCHHPHGRGRMIGEIGPDIVFTECDQFQMGSRAIISEDVPDTPQTGSGIDIAWYIDDSQFLNLMMVMKIVQVFFDNGIVTSCQGMVEAVILGFDIQHDTIGDSHKVRIVFVTDHAVGIHQGGQAFGFCQGEQSGQEVRMQRALPAGDRDASDEGDVLLCLHSQDKADDYQKRVFFVITDCRELYRRLTLF